MQFGVQLYSLRELIGQKGLKEALRLVSAAGFSGVEFAGFYGYGAEQLQELLERYHLKAISAHVGAQEMEAAIPILKKLGVGCAIIPFIPFNIGTSFEEGLQACRSSEALLRENGMILGYHNHAHEFNGGTDILKRLAENIPALKLELDVFWLAVAGIRATDYIKEQRERLIYLHIKELGENAESVNPVVEEGRADIENVLKLGREMNVEWSILEVEKVGVPVEEYLARSYEFMKKYQ